MALNKPVTGSYQYLGDAPAGIYFLSYGNNGIINMDADQTDLTHSNAVGGYWQVDLGGVYNIRHCVFWNRAAAATRSVGATISMLNWYGWPVGRITLDARNVQSRPITLFLPSSTPVGTGTATGTPTNTASASTSKTQTPIETQSLSPGAQPSATASGTATPPSTPSTTGSLTATPSATGSALSPLSSCVKIEIFGGVPLNMQELLVLTPVGKVVSVPANGAVTSASSILQPSYGLFRSNDLAADPNLALSFFHTGTGE